jgi:hypothetical protein
MSHNRSWNREGLREYLLTSYVWCGYCGRALTSGHSGGHSYYRHDHRLKRNPASAFNAIRADQLEPHALDYLFNFFLDRPAFEDAVKQAMPSDDDRKALEEHLNGTKRQLQAVEAKIRNLISAIENGADVSLLLKRQDELKSERAAIARRMSELEETVNGFPDSQTVKHQAMLLRLPLCTEHKGKDWRKLSYDEIRRFLQYLFGVNTKQTKHGISVARSSNSWTLNFRGQMEFHEEVINGRPTAKWFSQMAELHGKQIMREYENLVEDADLRLARDNSLSNSGFRPSWRASRVR